MRFLPETGLHSTVILGTILAAVLVVPPIAALLFGTFRTAPPGSPGSFSLSHFIEVFSEPNLPIYLTNTLVLASIASFVAIVPGSFIAWLVARTNIPFKGVIKLLMIVGLCSPPLVTAASWVFLLAPRAGLYNIILRSITGLHFPIYSLWGMGLVQGISSMSLVFLTAEPAFKNVDASLEEVATISGASSLSVFFRITLPMVLPTIVSVSVLVLMFAIGSLGVPLLLGLPHNIVVFSTGIWRALYAGATPDFGLATAYSTILMVISLILTIVSRKLLGQISKFATVAGKAGRVKTIGLGKVKYLVSLLAILFTFMVKGAPVAVISFASIVTVYTPTVEVFSRISLKNWQYVFTRPSVRMALTNSTVLGSLGAFLTVLLASFLAHLIVKSKSKGTRILENLSMFPLAVPSVAVAIGLMWVYLIFPVGIYGTVWIILIAYLTKYFPTAVRMMTGVFAQIHSDLEEGAKVAGASYRSVFTRIVLPLVRPSAISTWLWLATHMIRELPMSLLLFASGTQVLAVELYFLSEETLEGMAVLSVALLLIMFGLYGIVALFGRFSEMYASRMAWLRKK